MRRTSRTPFREETVSQMTVAIHHITEPNALEYRCNQHDQRYIQGEPSGGFRPVYAVDLVGVGHYRRHNQTVYALLRQLLSTRNPGRNWGWQLKLREPYTTGAA